MSLLFSRSHLLVRVRFWSSTVTSNCWKCARSLEQLVDDATFTCPCEERVLLPPTSRNYFTIMDCKQSYKIDVSRLRKKYHQLQILLHPDKYTLRPKEEQAIASDQSTLVNKAYSNLLNPYKRGLYLLKLNGLMIDERDNMSSDIEFLEDIMSLNESVSSTSSESELKELEKRVDGDIQHYEFAVAGSFSTGDNTAAKEGLTRLKYFVNLKQELQNKLSIS